MTSISLVGSPEAICLLLDNIILSGNEILTVTKTKNGSTYIVTYAPPGPVPAFFLLKEDGDYLLLESGDKIIL